MIAESFQVKTNCLNREDRLITLQTGSPGLRRNRKALLSELSGLVKSARQLASALTCNEISPIIDEQELNFLVLKAFSMVLRAVKFLDIWFDRIEEERAHPEATQPLLSTQPPTPPADQVSFSTTPEDDEQTPQNRSRASLNLDEVRERKGRSVTRRRSRTPRSRLPSQRAQTPSQPSRPSSISTARQSISHRISWSARTMLVPNENFASQKLSAACDSFLGCLGSFLGLYLLSQTSTEVLVTTQHSVNAGRFFLTVVEAVWDRGRCRSGELEDMRNNMYARITDLVHTAQTVFQPPAASDDQDFESQSRKQLTESATHCIRGASECVEATRQVLEMIGDFEIAPTEDTKVQECMESESQNQPAQVESKGPELDEPGRGETPPPPTCPPPLPPASPPLLPPINTNFMPEEQPTIDSSEVSSPQSHRLSSSSAAMPPSLTNSISSQSDCSPLSFSSKMNHSDPQVTRIEPFQSSSLGVSTHLSGTTFAGSFRQSQKQPWSPVFPQDSQVDVRESSDDGDNTVSISDSFTQSESTLDQDVEEEVSTLLGKTYAHELVFNRDGEISGGSLPALIERLTIHDSTPDALFVSTFYLTFRLFASPNCFARALINRFEYVENSPHIAGPVRLRVYNVFKGWIESHWRVDCDSSALSLIIPFAAGPLAAALPAAGARLQELAAKVSETNTPLVPRLVSSIGKTNTAVAAYIAPDTPMPTPVISKSQLALLGAWRSGKAQPSMLDFDPLELARQLTLKVSRIFCSVLPEELLGCEWTKKSGSLALNVRAMSSLSTDLANLVAASVLRPEDHRTRAKIIKQWVKVSARCLELHNYDSLMAIVCSLNSTALMRLRRTWECVSAKTKLLLDGLKDLVDCSKNYTTLRGRLAGLMPPCLPFVGIYLTDLTFVDAGNQAMRMLPHSSSSTSLSSAASASTVSTASTARTTLLSPPDSGPCSGMPVINFDKHVKTARIISELQRFQIPYRLAEVPELQTWMQDQFVTVRSGADDGGESCLQRLYRRSCLLEPREQQSGPQAALANAAAGGSRVGLALMGGELRSR